MGGHRGEFWLVYVYSKNPKKCMLGIKFPSIEARYYITLGGKRATELYNHILLTLDNNGVEYSVEREDNKYFIKLPWTTGLAVAVFLLAIYAKRKPSSYTYILDKMIHGGMPLMRHLTNMVELALDLTEHLEDQQQKRLISHVSARTVSRIMNEIIATIKI
jgi:hypothetical protein